MRGETPCSGLASGISPRHIFAAAFLLFLISLFDAFEIHHVAREEHAQYRFRLEDMVALSESA